MASYIITTESGVEWLIESADSEREALEQYYDGGAEPHSRIEHTDDEEKMDYLRDMGQAS